MPAAAASARFRFEDIYPSVDGGRSAVKRITGEPIAVWADVFRDGHDLINVAVRWRRDGAKRWARVPMRLDNNDRWTAIFTPAEPGDYAFEIEAWTDVFGSWRKGALL